MMRWLLVAVTTIVVCVLLVGAEVVQSSPEFENPSAKVAELTSKWERSSIIEALSLLAGQIDHGDNPAEARSLREAAELKMMLGESTEAVRMLERALEVERAAKNPGGEAETSAQLAYVYSFSGNAAAAETQLTRALSLLDSIEDKNAEAMACYYAGETYYLREDIPSFLKYYDRALTLFRETQNARGEARALLASSYAAVGNENVKQGLAFAEQALAKWESIGDRRGYALSLVSLGLAQFKLGQSWTALDTLHRAETLFPNDVDRSERAILIYNLGRVYQYFGDCERALNYFSRSLELLQAENNLSLSVGNLWTLGGLSYSCGDKSESLRYLETSLDLSRKLGKHHGIVVSLLELAEIHLNEGRFDQAEANYRQALDVLAGNNYQWSRARVYRGLGRMNERLNKLDPARENYSKALEIDRAIKDAFAESETLYHLANVEYSAGNFDKALELSKASIDLTEAVSFDVTNAKLKSTYLSNVFVRYELHIQLLMTMHSRFPDSGYALQAFQTSEKARARSMLETLQLAEANTIQDADPAAVDRENEIRTLLNGKADKLTDLLSRGAPAAESHALSVEIRELEGELERIQADLRLRSPIYSSIKHPLPFDVTAFQNEFLDDDTVLLEFSLGERESYLWMIERNDLKTFVLPSREKLESRVTKIREILTGREMKDGETIEEYQQRLNAADDLYWQEARELSKDLLGPIADQITGKRLIVVPDGKLHYFPISALPLPSSAANEPMLLTNETIYEPSASTLSVLAADRTTSKLPSKNLLVFSDPIFSTEDPRMTGRTPAAEVADVTTDHLRFVESLNSLRRLTASAEEGESIASIAGRSRTDIYSGFDATRERALAIDMSDYKIVHFATHGWINEQRPELSGIVLSRFDEKGEKRDEFVRLHDIYGLRLAADMVVLSACETGVGKEVKGEGLISLTSGFMQAGAKSVLSSFWKVDDRSTLALMKDFYGSLASDNVSPSKALQIAQTRMWQNPRYRSPFYWAAFSVQGDFRRRPELATYDLRSIGLILFAVLVIGAGIYGWRRYGRKGR